MACWVSQQDQMNWADQATTLSLECAATPYKYQATMLRQAYALMGNPPAAIGALIAPSLPLAHFEALLGVGAYETAAIALLGTRIGYLVSRGPGGDCLASVVLPGMSEDLCVEAPTEALALLSALLAATVQLLEQPHAVIPRDQMAAISIN